MEQTIQLAGVAKQSIVDGPGLRYTIFTQGCSHACVGCHNEETWPFEGGTATKVEKIIAEIKANPLLRGLTLSGGEPLERPEELLPLVKEVKKMGKDIVCYSGYTLEELLGMQQENSVLAEVLQHIDILIDGRFELEQKDLTLPFRGSANQRVLDLPKSLAQKIPIIIPD